MSDGHKTTTMMMAAETGCPLISPTIKQELRVLLDTVIDNAL